MKPKPLVALNHLTVPVVILTSPRCAKALSGLRDLRTGSNPISAMFLGSRAGSARSTSKSIVRMGRVYAIPADIASDKRVPPARLAKLRRRWITARESARTANRSIQPADLFLGHDALDIAGLALDAVTRAAVGLDRQTRDDGIDVLFPRAGAALRPLRLMMNVFINCEIVGHRLSF